MNFIIDKETYVQYRLAPIKAMDDLYTSEQLKSVEVSVLKQYEEK